MFWNKICRVITKIHLYFVPICTPFSCCILMGFAYVHHHFCHCRKLDGCSIEIPERIPLFTYWLKKFWWYGMHENMQIHKDSSLLGNSIGSRRLFDDGEFLLFSQCYLWSFLNFLRVDFAVKIQGWHLEYNVLCFAGVGSIFVRIFTKDSFAKQMNQKLPVAYLKIATQFRFLPIQQFLNSFVVDQKMQSFFFE